MGPCWVVRFTGCHGRKGEPKDGSQPSGLRKRVMESGSLRHKARKRDGGARCEGRWCSLGGSESEVLLEHLRRGLQQSSVKGENWNLGFEGR